MLKKENPWTSLLAAGLHASADDLADGTLDAKTLVRLVDRRVRGLRSEASQKLDHWVSAAARTSLNQSSDSGRTHGLASFAELTQRWPVLHGPPGLGAFKLAPGQAPEFGQLRSSLQQAAEQVRRSASSSTLGRTLARTMSGRDLARSPGGASAEWDLFKSLDSNLKHLERALRESTAKQRRQALSRRRRRRDGDDTADGPRSLLPSPVLGGPSSLPDLQAALKDFQRTVEKHLPKSPAGAGALVSDFLRTQMSPLKLRPQKGSNGSEDGGDAATADANSVAGGVLPAWQILAPLLLRLPLDTAAAAGAAAQAAGEAAAQHPLSHLLRKRRRDSHGHTAAADDGKQQHRGGSVRDPGRSIAIVTTASLPWMTGTSVNPLLRAAYLARDGTRRVTLLLPWLAPSDQVAVHPNHMFATPAEQGEYVRQWVTQRCGFAPDIKLTFYPGRWAPDKCSILPVGDITQYVPDAEADVAVLEEPEHLTWYHHGVRWTDKFKHVVGVVHTNYLEYARREENGNMKEAVLRFVNQWVVRAYCHKVVKLSDAVQQLPRAQTCFVHGVSPRFLAIGQERAQRMQQQQQQLAATETAAEAAVAAPAAVDKQPAAVEDKGVYFIGKVVWGKGYTELLDLVQRHCSTHSGLHVDVYGGGDDMAAIQASATSRQLPLDFKGPKDHADPALHGYRVFVNPSLSDVVATTTAEALAMGKWVVVADHPSNAFFAGRFRNCLVYTTPEQFSSHLEHALNNPPAALSPQEQEALTWEAATDRFMDAAEPDHLRTPPASPSSRSRRRRQPGAALLEGVADWAAAQLHQTLTGMEPLRGLAGAGPNTLRTPDNLDTWRPCRWTGGALDRKDRVVPQLPRQQKPPAAAAA